MAVLIAGCIASPVVAPTVRPFRYPITSSTEPSGLRAVFEVAPDFGTSGVVLSVAVGSADEPPELAGLAHLVEHLALEERRDGVTRWNRLSAVGTGEQNAWTTWDTTTFFAFGPPENLEAMTGMFAELFDEPLASVDQATFDHELQVVRAEMHTRTETGTQTRSLGLLASAVFPADHPYSRPVIGTEETLSRVTLADARAFAKAHYRPDTSVIALTSPSSFEAQRALLGRTEARHPWPAREPMERAKSVDDVGPPPAAPTLVDKTFPTATATLWIGWRIPPVQTEENDEAVVLSMMVAGTFWRHLYDRDRDIASVHAGVWPGVKGGVFCVEAELNEGRDPAGTAASLIRTMGHGLSEGTYLQNNFDAYRRYAATEIVASEEPFGSRTEHLAESTRLTGDATYMRSRAERTTRLSAGHVADFYHRYLSPERAHAVFVHAGPSVGEAAEAGRAKAGVQGTDKPPTPSLAEVRSWMRTQGIAGAKHVKLDNGLEVVVLPRPGAQFHSVVVAYHGGEGDEEVVGSSTASLWAKERSRGSAGVWGVEYSDRVGPDLTFETLRATGSDLANTFDQLRREDEFRIFWPPPQFSNRIQAFERNEHTAQETFDRRMSEAFFGQHPYGRSITTERLNAVKPNDVYTFLDTVHRPDNGIVVIVGDVDPSRAIGFVTSALGRSPPPTLYSLHTPAPLKHAGAKPGARVLIEDRGASSSVRMRLLCALPTAREGSLGVEWVFATALGGRMKGELRDRAAVSYSIDASIEALRGGTTVLVLDGDVGAAHLPIAVHALRRFLEDPVANVFDADQLAQARADAARWFNLSLSTTEPLAMRIVGAWNIGRPIEEIDHYPEVVAGASREDMARLAEQCRANWVLGLLGDESRIQAGLDGWSP